jgi:hypothetical protein
MTHMSQTGKEVSISLTVIVSKSKVLRSSPTSPPHVGQTSHSLNIRFQEHITYIRNNNPQLAYAQHILQNQHKYGQMNSIMTLLKPLNNPNLLIPYEQYYIQTLY